MYTSQKTALPDPTLDVCHSHDKQWLHNMLPNFMTLISCDPTGIDAGPCAVHVIYVSVHAHAVYTRFIDEYCVMVVLPMLYIKYIGIPCMCACNCSRVLDMPICVCVVILTFLR